MGFGGDINLTSADLLLKRWTTNRGQPNTLNMRMLKILVVFTLTIGIAVACDGASSQQPQNPATAPGAPPTGQKHHHTEDGFRNYPPVPDDPIPSVGFIVRRLVSMISPRQTLPNHTISEAETLTNYRALSGRNTITWLGHSTFLVRIDGVTILTDPFLGERAGIFPRFVEPGISVDKLPKIDVMIVSHNHFDHLDKFTIEALTHRKDMKIFVPLRLCPFFTERGYDSVVEMDWWDTATVNGFRLTALPAVHESGRGITDENKTLWISWELDSPAGIIYFAGDTGYSDTIFKQIGNSFKGFDLTFLPIGAYAPRDSQGITHTTPKEAVRIGTDIGAGTLIGMHWGTIALSDEPIDEPPMKFNSAGKNTGLAEQNIWLFKIGETREIIQSSIR